MKKHPPYFENLHPPFIKGDASYGYIYRNKYLPLHFIFTPPILKILLLFPKGYFIMNLPPPPPPPILLNLEKYGPPAYSTSY